MLSRKCICLIALLLWEMLDNTVCSVKLSSIVQHLLISSQEASLEAVCLTRVTQGHVNIQIQEKARRYKVAPHPFAEQPSTCSFYSDSLFGMATSSLVSTLQFTEFFDERVKCYCTQTEFAVAPASLESVDEQRIQAECNSKLFSVTLSLEQLICWCNLREVTDETFYNCSLSCSWPSDCKQARAIQLSLRLFAFRRETSIASLDLILTFCDAGCFAGSLGPSLVKQYDTWARTGDRCGAPSPGKRPLLQLTRWPGW